MEAMQREKSPPEEIIRVESLELGYGERVILKNIDFSIHSGEIVTILGGSGCGKSTLLKGLIGLLPPKKGRIVIGGNEISGIDREARLRKTRRMIGVLFQAGALIGSLTLAENVALPVKEFTDLPKLLIHDIVSLKLEMVGLKGFEDYYPAELSGGMRKRAALARAIALDPKILFCDEPSAGLDPVISGELDQLLIEINNSLGITMVVVTHELHSIENISHRSIMLDGETKGIIAVGSPDRLKTESDDPRVLAFFRIQSRHKD